jgi:hypothetical protein
MHCAREIITNKEYADVYGTTEEQVLRFLSDLRKELHMCPNCGGLQPNVKFSFENRSYEFVCTEITDGQGNIVAETDYKQLEEYCHAKNAKSK